MQASSAVDKANRSVDRYYKAQQRMEAKSRFYTDKAQRGQDGEGATSP